MTLYWWSHWFWITTILETISGASIDLKSVETLKLTQNNKNYNKREPLIFPVPVIDSDTILERNLNPFKIEGLLNNSAKPLNESIIKNNINIENIVNNNNNNNSTIIKSPSVNLSNISLSNNNKNNSISISQIGQLQTNVTEKRDEVVTNIQNVLSISKEAIIINETLIKNSTIETEINTNERQSKLLSEYSEELEIISSGRPKNLLARSASVQKNDNKDSLASEALSAQDVKLDGGIIFGICCAVIAMFSGISLAGIFIYRRRYTNKPQTLNEPDSSGYIDDSIIRDNSDEMYSLDNDSFLNSLEAMTIQNYWTDNVKHTKL